MADKVELKIGDIIKMKKPHPCGTNAWEINALVVCFLNVE